MKKALNVVYMFAFVLLFSCTPEENNIFEDSSANRIEAALKNTQEVLTGAVNGWHMEYFPAAQQVYGGYNLFISFSDDKAVVSSEMNDAENRSEGLYSLKQSAGPVLSFDSYNENIHFFADPDSEVSGEGRNGVGMGGDFEFLIMKATPDSVILKGKKTSNKIVMTPVGENDSWSDYLTELQNAYKEMYFRAYEFQVGDDVIPVRVSSRTLIFTYLDENENEVTQRASYIVTPDGYKFYEPLIIKGVEVKELLFTPEGEFGFFTVVGNPSARLVPVFPPVNELLTSGEWYFKYSGLGAYTKLYWNYTKVNGLDAIGEELYMAYLGFDANGAYGFNFRSYDPSAGGLYGGALHFNTQAIGEDQITFTFALAGSGDGVWYYSNAAFAYIINPLHGGATKTFTLSVDDQRDPTSIQMVDNDDPDNVMILDAQPVLWPYDK